MKTFIDEAGNTGSDLKQSNQPFFILSAITLLEEKTDEVITELKSQFSQNKEKEEVEIKAVNWAKSAKKAKALQNIIEKFLFSDGHIAIVIIEKRYMISAMIVDCYFDPEYNDIKDFKWINDSSEKNKAVNYFYTHLTDPIVYKLWDSIKMLDKEMLECILDIIIEAIDNNEYIALLNGARNHINELVNSLDLEDYAKKYEFNNSAIRSPNYTALLPLMNCVITHCRALKRDTSIVYDSAVEFNQSYQHLYNIFTQISIDIPTPNGPILTWKENVKELAFSNSKTDEGLQIADIISSSVNQLMMKALNKKPITDYDLFNIALILALEKTYKSVWYVVSTKFYKSYVDMQERGISKLKSVQ